MSALLVFVGGCLGAVMRFGTDRFISGRHGTVFPLGTFTVNMVGSAVLGLTVGGAPASLQWVVLLVGTGFCGALTTYSTFSLETLRLLEDGAVLEASLNVVGSLVVGLVCVVGGYGLGQLLF